MSDQADSNTEHLPDRMRTLAATHQRGSELKRLADLLDAELANDPPNPMRVLGAWARARKLWCELTGEPLV